MGFEVFFEIECLFTGAKCDGCLDLPGPVFGCVGNLSGVKSTKAGIKVLCQPYVIARGIGFTNKNVYIMKAFMIGFFRGLPRRSSQQN
jgi:hypothetical protein